MMKIVGDHGGPVSKSDVEYHQLLMRRAAAASYVIERYESFNDEHKNNPVEKEKFEAAKEDLAIVTDEMVSYRNRFERAFELSADSVAERKLLEWYALQLTYYTTDALDTGKETPELFPLFRGDTFEEKRRDFLHKDDEDWDPSSEQEKLEKSVYELVFEKLIQAMTVWYYQFAAGKDGIDAFIAAMNKQEKDNLEQDAEELIPSKKEPEEPEGESETQVPAKKRGRKAATDESA
jgi:hypothetical protein